MDFARTLTRSPLRFTMVYAVISLAFMIGPDLMFARGFGAGPFLAGEFLGLHTVFSVAFVSITTVWAVLLLRHNVRPAVQVDRRGDVILRNLDIAVATVDQDGIVMYANDAFARLFGGTAAACVNRPFETLISRHSLDGSLDDVLKRGPDVSQKGSLRGEGVVHDVLLRALRIAASDRSLRGERGWVITVRDMGAVNGLAMLNRLYLRAMDSCVDGVAVADFTQPDLPLVYVNRAFEELTGYTALEMLGKNCRFLQGNDRAQPQIADIRRAIADRKPISTVLRNYTKTGRMFWNDLRMLPMFNESGTVTHFISISRDLTELRSMREELDKVVLRDALTGLANTSGLEGAFRGLQERGGQDRGAPERGSSILFVKFNIESFHDINTTFGYEAGDALLVQIAQRLNANPAMIAGRLGRDEFVVIAALAEPGEQAGVINRLREDLDHTFIVPGASLRVFFHIGYALGRPGEGFQSLMRKASAALHDEQQRLTHLPREYDSNMDREISRRVRIISDLQLAVSNEDFVLHYQPKVTLETGRIVGAEALIRWQHSTFGLQLPGQFIAAAEHTGLIVPMGEWALRAACRFAVAVNRHRPEPFRIAVNVSQKQFRQTDLPFLVENVLAETGADSDWITLELTESMFADDSPANVRALHMLRDLGVGISIDDFGTGYSSLRCLSAFPVTEIKIDRSFVMGMERDRHKRAVIEAVTHLGRELEAHVVAEGIETEAERRMLLELGCEFGQGYFFSLPLIGEDFTWLANHTSDLPFRQAKPLLLPGAG